MYNLIWDLRFQRQAFLKNKVVPGIFGLECWKGIIFWLVPTLFYVSSLFLMSFSREATPFLSISAGALIHPLVLGKSCVVFKVSRFFASRLESAQSSEIEST